jgi:hypothetical protein
MAEANGALAGMSRHSIRRSFRPGPQRLDRHDDPKPRIGRIGIAVSPEMCIHLPRLDDRSISMTLQPRIRGAGDVEVSTALADF